MGRVPHVNRNQRRSGPRKTSAPGLGNWFSALKKQTPSIDNGMLINFFIELRELRQKLALTPLQFSGALLGTVTTATDLYVMLTNDILGSGDSGGNDSVSAGIFTALANSMNGSPQGQFLVYLIFTGCVAWVCILTLLLLTRKQGEVRNIAGYVITFMTALFISAWAHNLFEETDRGRISLSESTTVALTVVAAAIFLFIAKTQFKLTQEKVTQVQLRRVNLILTFIGASILAVVLKTGVLNG